ncbi:unnamed protein product, partial [Ectocarpus sp. 12 AP-2014]
GTEGQDRVRREKCGAFRLRTQIAADIQLLRREEQPRAVGGRGCATFVTLTLCLFPSPLHTGGAA